MAKTIIYHDMFMKNVRYKINDIVTYRNAGDKINAAKAAFDLATYKVAYYEQFIDEKDHSSYQKIYAENYHAALVQLAGARDECMELDIYEN